MRRDPDFARMARRPNGTIIYTSRDPRTALRAKQIAKGLLAVFLVPIVIPVCMLLAGIALAIGDRTNRI